MKEFIDCLVADIRAGNVRAEPGRGGRALYYSLDHRHYLCVFHYYPDESRLAGTWFSRKITSAQSNRIHAAIEEAAK